MSSSTVPPNLSAPFSPLLSSPLFFYRSSPILYYFTSPFQPLFFLPLVQVGNSMHVFLELPPVTYHLTPHCIHLRPGFIHSPTHPSGSLTIPLYSYFSVRRDHSLEACASHRETLRDSPETFSTLAYAHLVMRLRTVLSEAFTNIRVYIDGFSRALCMSGLGQPSERRELRICCVARVSSLAICN
jgi:hypothetical protein